MKNKGFTLVELLGVIVLLACVGLLATISITNFVKNTNDNLEDATKQVLYVAAGDYLNKIDDLKNNQVYYVTIADLIKEDLISSNFLDAQESKKITVDSCVKVDITNGNYTYEFLYTCDKTSETSWLYDNSLRNI